MYKINVYEGVNEIKFGMTTKEIEKIIKKKPERFRRFDDDEYDTDNYDEFFVYYKEPGVCEAIEFFNESELVLLNVNLFKFNYKELKDFISKYDIDIEEEDSGFTSYKLGLACYAPFIQDSLESEVESIIIFEKGYYD